MSLKVTGQAGCINHNGKQYQDGDTIPVKELKKGQAAALIASGSAFETTQDAPAKEPDAGAGKEAAAKEAKEAEAKAAKEAEKPKG